MIALRGATTIKENNESEIKNASIELFSKLIESNDIDLNDIITIEISCTNDITKAYPGKFIREHFNLSDVAIMHFNEMEVDKDLNGFLPLCIRLLLLVNVEKDKKKFIYLNDAKKLRKDLLDE
ncbi:chorismate mutase [Clostridium sp. cel8]|jgi:chorismate mutase|uniref:chorismate mutase n=1 Tax=unclassified Clostridium TaxID=2614128 RepID=UPI0015F606E6|nr:chorismate mutase [Clostridium sp. cel8]MBA5851939.1 chorismate mutase [Clostridium sp. cel8]